MSDVRGDNFVILRDEARAGTQVLHELAACSRVHMQASTPSRNPKDPDPPRGPGAQQMLRTKNSNEKTYGHAPSGQMYLLF